MSSSLSLAQMFRPLNPGQVVILCLLRLVQLVPLKQNLKLVKRKIAVELPARLGWRAGDPPLLWGHLGRPICLSFSSSSWPRICSCPWRSNEGRAAYDAVSQSAPSRNILPVPPVISYATEWCGILN